MPTAEITHTTTRRSALRGFGFATLAAGLAVPALAAPSSADTELIRQCDRIVAIRGGMDKLYAIRTTIEEERRTEPQLEKLYEEREAAIGAIEDLPDVTTREGARALARASMALADRDLDGTVRWPGSDAEWLAGAVVAFLAEGGIA